jgi:hypothetical protein
MPCRQTKVYTGSRLTYVHEGSEQMFTNVTPKIQSLCCYDYFKEKLCSHCGVMIIYKNCEVTVLWLF